MLAGALYLLSLLNLVLNLQAHSTSEEELTREVQRWDSYEITELIKEMIT